MEISELKENKILEIALLALTYRLSLKSICEIYKTDEEDIQNAIKKIKNDDLSRSLYYLNIETINESKEMKEYSKKKAIYYIKKKNLLLTKSKETKDANRKEEYNFLVKELCHQIDDTILNSTVSKKLSDLTDEEKDAIANYRLKYYCPIKLATKILHRDRSTILELESEKASKDYIFAIKLDNMNIHFKEKTSGYIANDTMINLGKR